MEYYPIPEEPQYNNQIRMLQATDPAHADLFNQIFKLLINNIEYLRLTGINSEDNLLNAVMSVIVRRDITIPNTGWDVGAPEGEKGAVYIDLGQADVTEDMIPVISLYPIHMKTAQECGMSTVSRSISGGIRIYAQKVPTEELKASLVLLRASSGSAEGGGGSASYVLPVATATRLGGVKIGDNVSVEKDGTISVDKADLFEDAVATEEATEEMLNSVFGDTM